MAMKRLAMMAAFAVVLSLAGLGCKSESEQESMVRKVKETLKKEGIQGGVDPVVELTGSGKEWVGTARYGDIVYDLRVLSKDGKLWLERTMRPPPR
jgi:hypothetical protein